MSIYYVSNVTCLVYIVTDLFTWSIVSGRQRDAMSLDIGIQYLMTSCLLIRDDSYSLTNFMRRLIGQRYILSQTRHDCETSLVVYFWGFYDIKFKLTQYKAKLGLIPQYTFDLREFDITNLKFGSNTTIYLAQHVTLTHYKPKPGLIPQHTKQTSLY